jgi:hypothetical protein
MNKRDNWSILDEHSRRGAGFGSADSNSSSAGSSASERLKQFFVFKQQAVSTCLMQGLQALENWIVAQENKQSKLASAYAPTPIRASSSQVDSIGDSTNVAFNAEMAVELSAQQTRLQPGQIAARNPFQSIVQFVKDGISPTGKPEGNDASSAATARKNLMKSALEQVQVVSVMGHTITFYGVRRYHVSFASVSLNIPLQRFLSKLISFACCGGLCLEELIATVQTVAPIAQQLLGQPEASQQQYPQFLKAIIALADYPLRAMSWASQVIVGMWRRNGSAVENLIYNYTRYYFSQMFRHNDLHAVQFAGLFLGPDAILALSIDRFEVTNALEVDSYFTTSSNDLLREYRPPLISELLHFLCNYVTAVPVILMQAEDLETASASGQPGQPPIAVNPSAAEIETLKTVVSREVVHQVLAGEVTDHRTGERSATGVSFGTLQKVKSSFGGNRGHVTDALIKEVADEFCVQMRIGSVSTQDEGKIVYELAPKGFELVDLEYVNLSFMELQQAVDKVKTFRRKQSSASTASKPLSAGADKQSAYQPIIQPAAIPKAHESFCRTRHLLFRPLFLTLIERVLNICMREECRAGGVDRYVIALICKAIHLLTLQLHIYDLRPTQFSNGTSNWWASVDYPTFFEDTFKSKTSMTVEGAPEQSPLTGCGVGVLKHLATIWNTKLLGNDECYESGLGWLLKEYFTRSIAGRGYLQSVNISFAVKSLTGGDVGGAVGSDAGANSAAASKAALLAKKKAAAQQRALAALSKQASAFSSSFANDMKDDDEEDTISDQKSVHSTVSSETQPTGSEHATASANLETGALDCILCRERTGEATGHLCYAFPSTQLARAATESESSDALIGRMKNTYRVVCVEGCDVFAERDNIFNSTPSSSSSSSAASASAVVTNSPRVVGHLQQGDHVIVACQSAMTDSRVRTGRESASHGGTGGSIGGKNSIVRVHNWVYLTHPIQGWAKLYDTVADQGNTKKGVSYLRPVLDLMYSRHGMARLHGKYSLWSLFHMSNCIRFQ